MLRIMLRTVLRIVIPGIIRTVLPSRMSKFRSARALTMVALIAVFSACNRGDDATSETSMEKALRTSSNLDSVAVRSATVALRQFLDASREGSATRGDLEALTQCDDDAGADTFFPTTLLAGYTLLPFDMHGDTVVARASVVTVAEQDVDRRTQSFTARQRVREDVLEWDVIPTGVPDEWVVCNGLRFGYLGADSLTVWRPEGTSHATALQLVDSIMKARGN